MKASDSDASLVAMLGKESAVLTASSLVDGRGSSSERPLDESSAEGWAELSGARKDDDLALQMVESSEIWKVARTVASSADQREVLKEPSSAERSACHVVDLRAVMTAAG